MDSTNIFSFLPSQSCCASWNIAHKWLPHSNTVSWFWGSNFLKNSLTFKRQENALGTVTSRLAKGFCCRANQHLDAWSAQTETPFSNITFYLSLQSNHNYHIWVQSVHRLQRWQLLHEKFNDSVILQDATNIFVNFATIHGINQWIEFHPHRFQHIFYWEEAIYSKNKQEKK